MVREHDPRPTLPGVMLPIQSPCDVSLRLNTPIDSCREAPRVVDTCSQIVAARSRRPKLASIGGRFCIRLEIAALQGRLPSVASAQNPGHKGWVSQEGTP